MGTETNDIGLSEEAHEQYHNLGELPASVVARIYPDGSVSTSQDLCDPMTDDLWRMAVDPDVLLAVRYHDEVIAPFLRVGGMPESMIHLGRGTYVKGAIGNPDAVLEIREHYAKGTPA